MKPVNASLPPVQKFTHLSSVIRQDALIGAKRDHQIGKAGAAFDVCSNENGTARVFKSQL